ncbi:hypothetical protein LT493_20645 [Streptomyces tricolor]|nr:hypothetical protein [Streptomyces tricolor]
MPLPSREAVIDDTVQTAPLTLIDGSWLQGFTDYEQASSEIGHLAVRDVLGRTRQRRAPVEPPAHLP